MKTIAIAGRVTKDAQIRQTQNGDKLASFSVAVDDGWGDNKRTLFFDCTQFGKRGESVAPMLTKGKQVSVSGEPQCFEVKEGYEASTYKRVAIERRCGMVKVPISEALTIRSVEDVRREAYTTARKVAANAWRLSPSDVAAPTVIVEALDQLAQQAPQKEGLVK